MCGNFKLQNTPHPINPWVFRVLLLLLLLRSPPIFARFFNSPIQLVQPIIICGTQMKCVNRKIDSWLWGSFFFSKEKEANKWMNEWKKTIGKSKWAAAAAKKVKCFFRNENVGSKQNANLNSVCVSNEMSKSSHSVYLLRN